MTPHIYRVTVRGKFDQLTGAQRTELLAAAPDHDITRGGFTPEGTLTYNRDLLAFTFRYELTISGEDGEREAGRHAQERAAATLTSDGYGYRHLRSSVTDMRDIKIRRQARRGS